MKNSFSKLFWASFLAAVIVIASGCAGGKALRTQVIQDQGQITGTFTLILCSDMEYDSLETLAFLSLEGSGYTLSPYMASFDCGKTNSVSGQNALQEAISFISSKNPNYEQPEIREIYDQAGKVVGYEVRPLYAPMAYGISDVLSTGYFLMSDGNIRVIINLSGQVKDEFEGSSR